METQTNDEEKISLATLAGGAVVEMFDEALQEAFLDIANLNLPAKTPRTVSVTLKLTSNEDRDFVEVDIAVEKKLAKVRPHETRIELARGAGGRVIAVELRTRQAELPGVNADVTDITTARNGKE